MAGDWIKMRVWLRRDPRVASMADFLAVQRRFMDHISDASRHACTESAYEYITSDVTRAITVVSLLEVWGVARERGDRENDDLLLKHCTLDNLDDICSTPGFGDAMEYVEWALEETAKDKKGRPVSLVRFPDFFKETESPDDRYKKQHAEAQARYRAKQKAGNDTESDSQSDITSDITVTPREEKRREEIKPKKGLVRFDAFWADWPKSERKGGKAECAKVWTGGNLDAEADAILAHVKAMRITPGWTKQNGEFVPAPVVYLRGRRWDGAEVGETAERDIFAGAR